MILLHGLALATVGTLAGHLIAYEVRYGATAQQVQSAGAHAYFPVLAKTGLGIAAFCVLLALIVVGVARMVAGRRIPDAAPPAFLRTFALLFSIQLAMYVLLETVEAAAAGASSGSPTLLLLWGTVGQLPASLLAALALRWLEAKVAPVVALVLMQSQPALTFMPRSLAVITWQPAAAPAVTPEHLAAAHTRRGPPL
jgi:hypothetical protein